MDAPDETRDFAKILRRKLSLPEGLLWRALRAHKLDGLHFRKQHPIGPYILDFYCDSQKLAVEVDGQSHGFGDRPERDDRRDAWLAAKGVRTLRISAELVLHDVDDAVNTIRGLLEEHHSRSPSGGAVSEAD
jgi:very-short-patch-repair endonuclease